MLDFSSLVLRACMDTFARPVTITPLASQPSAPAYTGRGIWSSKPVDVQTESGILSSQIQTLDLRAVEFPVLPQPGDKVLVDAFGSLPRIGLCLIEDTDDDGQGGIVLSLKVVQP
jgi:hypothetical protein